MLRVHFAPFKKAIFHKAGNSADDCDLLHANEKRQPKLPQGFGASPRGKR